MIQGSQGEPVPRNTIIPTYNHGQWLSCQQNKRVSISNIVRVQEYTTYNTLKPTKHKSTNRDMIELIDTPQNTQTQIEQAKNKSCVNCFLGNCSSFSVKMKEYTISKHKTFDMWSLVETHDTKGIESFWEKTYASKHTTTKHNPVVIPDHMVGN